MISDNSFSSYALIDNGNGRKLERFGAYLIDRPSPQAERKPLLPRSVWDKADAAFSSLTGWVLHSQLPETWVIDIDGILFKIKLTDVGHLGIFPEQHSLWRWMRETIGQVSSQSTPLRVLNLFAHTGGSTLFSSKNFNTVTCHVDASKSVVSWAKENALLNALPDSQVRWIIDDVSKFLLREVRRGIRYDAIILDPPTFGHGPDGQIFKIDKHLEPLLETCKGLLANQPLFVLLSCHTPGYSPELLHASIARMMQDKPGMYNKGKLFLTGSEEVTPLESGTFACWQTR